MRKKFGVLGLVAVVAVILAIGLAGAVFAAGPNPDQGTQTQNQGEVCLSGDCEPNDYSYSHNYLEPGPHGLGDAAPAGEGTQTQNQGEECPCGDGEPNDYSYSYEYETPGPHGAQKGVSD